MRHIGTALFILAAASTIAAIWSPIGAWWQWLASAILLFLAGAAISGRAAQTDDEAYGRGGFIPGPTTITNNGDTPERLVRPH